MFFPGRGKWVGPLGGSTCPQEAFEEKMVAIF
jgi:hypothetical protein